MTNSSMSWRRGRGNSEVNIDGFSTRVKCATGQKKKGEGDSPPMERRIREEPSRKSIEGIRERGANSGGPKKVQKIDAVRWIGVEVQNRLYHLAVKRDGPV